MLLIPCSSATSLVLKIYNCTINHFLTIMIMLINSCVYWLKECPMNKEVMKMNAGNRRSNTKWSSLPASLTHQYCISDS